MKNNKRFCCKKQRLFFQTSSCFADFFAENSSFFVVFLSFVHQNISSIQVHSQLGASTKFVCCFQWSIKMPCYLLVVKQRGNLETFVFHACFYTEIYTITCFESMNQKISTFLKFRKLFFPLICTLHQQKHQFFKSSTDFIFMILQSCFY